MKCVQSCTHRLGARPTPCLSRTAEPLLLADNQLLSPHVCDLPDPLTRKTLDKSQLNNLYFFLWRRKGEVKSIIASFGCQPSAASCQWHVITFCINRHNVCDFGFIWESESRSVEDDMPVAQASYRGVSG
jgi:hypothetical protein